MTLKGRCHLFGDDVNTDEIIPARYLNTSDPAELAMHVMEDADPDFYQKLQKGDVIVAQKNFGCGSSREHAPIAIKTAGVSCVIARSFARIFYRNSFNMGLPIFESGEAADKISAGDELEVDMATGVITNHTKNESYQAVGIPEFMQNLIRAGGLMESIRSKIAR
ncbi:MAG: 3-isopropylmalate dehydratase small subunit [bacterium]|nr:MAG: 3-isopropylmalate dehydratase small subunit [bacterium]